MSNLSLDQFSLSRTAGRIPDGSPIKGDLRIVALVLQASIRSSVMQSTTTDDLDVQFACYIATQNAASIASSIAINLPVELQSAFLEAAGHTEELADAMLAKMRKESKGLDPAGPSAGA